MKAIGVSSGTRKSIHLREMPKPQVNQVREVGEPTHIVSHWWDCSV